jgi:hypothetical protein
MTANYSLHVVFIFTAILFFLAGLFRSDSKRVLRISRREPKKRQSLKATLH